MAWIQKNNAPISKKIPFSLDRFDGGLNNKSSDTMLQNNQASDLLNMAFSDDGLMEKRHGVEQMLNTPLTKPINFLDVYAPINSRAEILIGTNEEIYKGVRTSVDKLFDGADTFNQGVYEGCVLNNGKLTLDTNSVLNISNIDDSLEYVFKGEGINDFTLNFDCQDIDIPIRNQHYQRTIELLDKNNNVLFEYHEFIYANSSWVYSGGSSVWIDDEEVFYESGSTSYWCYKHEKPLSIKRTGNLWQVDRAKQSRDDEDYVAGLIDIDVNKTSSLISKIKINFVINDSKDIEYSSDYYNSWKNFNFVGKMSYEGKWTSPAYDVAPDEGTSFLSYIANFPLGTGVAIRVNSSDDGQYWDGWVNILGSGDTIPNKRMIKIEVILTINQTYEVPSFTNFTISCINKNSKYNLTKLCDVGGEVNGVNYVGKYYFVDGDEYRVYDGIDVFSIVSPPIWYTPLPQPAKIGKWYMHTTKPSTAYTNVNLSQFNGGVSYNQPTSKIWYEPCAEELDDNWKGASYLPLNPRFICLHGERLFLSGSVDNPHNVYITDISNAFYCPVGLGIQLPPNGDRVNGLVVFHDSVVVGRNDDVHVIYGNTNRTDVQNMFLLKKINTHTGFANQNVVQPVHNYLFYLGNDGNVYSMHTTQTNTELLATIVLSKTIDLFQEPFNFVNEDFKMACSIFYNDEYYLSIADKVLVYSYRYQAWTLYDKIYARDFVKFDEQFYIGNGFGNLYRFGNGYDDDGMPITAYWKSKRFDMGEPSVFKQFRELFIVAHTYDDYKSTIKVKFEVDYVDIVKTNTIESELSKWGEAVFGDKFNMYNILASYPIIIGQRGRVIRITFANGVAVHSIVPTNELLPLSVPEDTYCKVIDVDKFYRYNGYNWDEVNNEEIFQPLKVYEINGEYEFRGRR